MKKIVSIFFITLCIGISSASAQLYSMGLGMGQSFSKETWSSEQWKAQEKYLEGFNLVFYAEFFNNPNFKWRTEFMYNGLGSKEYVNTVQYVNQTDFISFDNYLKCCLPLFSWTPYFLIGPRLGDLSSRTASVFPDAVMGMSSFSLSAAAGIGVERVNFNKLKLFVEVFYNRNMNPLFKGSVISNNPNVPVGTTMPETITNQNFEWRIGFKYVFEKRDKCPHVDNSAGNPPGAQ